MATMEESIQNIFHAYATGDYEYVIGADTTFVSEEEFNAAYAAAMEVIKND